ncbi:aspartate-semialdehyde dehydrogenase, partial [mine drainage metagenome]
MSDPRLPCAILGAGGYIGQQFARLLADHPFFEPPCLVGRDRGRSRTLEEAWVLAEAPPRDLARARIEPETPARLAARGVRVVFSALPSGTAGPIESALARRGVAVFSNAADHRLEPGVPLLVPEVNADHLELAGGRPSGRGLLVTNPNCSTTGLVLAIAPVVPLLRPRVIHVTTFQALSGAGYPGVPSLAIADNVIPYIPEEEEKMARETVRLLGRRHGRTVKDATIPVLASCVRVATRDGHLEAVTVEATRRPALADLERAWANFDPLAGWRLPTAPHPPVERTRVVDRPQPLRDRWAGTPERARGMAAVVGRVRWEPPYLRFVVLTHNAVRGGAGGSVLNAELAVEAG